jgi:hypothetical protein
LIHTTIFSKATDIAFFKARLSLHLLSKLPIFQSLQPFQSGHFTASVPSKSETKAQNALRFGEELLMFD